MGLKHRKLPDGWDDGWENARARAGQGPLVVVGYGDSIMQGHVATDMMAGGYFGLLRAALIAKYGLNGDFYGCFGQGLVSGASNYGTVPWSAELNGQAAAWTNTANFGICRGLKNSSGAAQTNWCQTFTAPYFCTQLELVYVDNQAGSFQFRIDSASPGQAFAWAINNGGASGTSTTNTAVTITCLGDSALKKITITGLPLAAHTVDIGFMTGSPLANVPCVFQGITIYTGNPTGVFFGWLMSGGALMGDGGANSGATNRPKILCQGPTNGNISGTNTGWGPPCNPHLLIVQAGINDAQNGLATSSSQGFDDMIRRYAIALERGRPGLSSMLVIGSCTPDEYTSDNAVSSFSTAAPLWHTYLRSMGDFADVYGYGFLNIQRKWGALPKTNGFLPTNDVHPTDAGHKDLGAELIALLV